LTICHYLRPSIRTSPLISPLHCSRCKDLSRLHLLPLGLGFQVFWSIRSIVQLRKTVLPEFHYLCLICYCIPLESSPLFSFPPSSIVFMYSTWSHDALFFEMPWSRHLYCQNVSFWPCLWLYSIRPSVFYSSSFLVVDILPLP
jgi:hypothetical protein